MSEYSMAGYTSQMKNKNNRKIQRNLVKNGQSLRRKSAMKKSRSVDRKYGCKMAIWPYKFKSYFAIVQLLIIFNEKCILSCILY